MYDRLCKSYDSTWGILVRCYIDCEGFNMNIYTKEGWLDVPHIEEVADRNNIAFIAIIGKRQIGKTYGVLKHMLDSDKRFILLRGMRTELEMLERNVNSPFEKIAGYEGRIVFERNSEYTADISRIDVGEDGDIKTSIGMGAALSSIGRVRGFNGDIYSDVVFDEAIPESHLLKVRHGGDAFLNMYTTVSGNRELEGRPPLRVWLLANSNNLDSDILNALDITDVVERMSLRGEESRIIKDRGIMILLPDSKAITEKRKKTALYKAIGSNSKFAKMAYENEFAYNDYSDVGVKPLQEYKPLIRIGMGGYKAGIVIFLHKNDKTIYIAESVNTNVKHQYSDTDYARNKFIREYPEIKAAFLRGRITFQNMVVKNKFLNYIDLA